MSLGSHGLNARVAGASILLALVVVGAFAVIIGTAEDLRSASRASRHSEQVVSAADRLQSLALDLESGARGYVITQKAAFLDPLRRAAAAYPAQARELELLTRGDSLQHRRVTAIAGAIADYQHRWTDLIVATARTNTAAARRLVATGRGKRRMDAIRRQFTAFVATEERLAARHDAHTEDAGRRGVLLGLIAVGGSALLILLYGSYLFRFVTMPVRAIAGGARRLAAGELTTRVPERGGGEVGELARDFNAMARSLDDQQAQILRRNVELEAVLDATLDGILMADDEGNVLFVNRTMEQFWRDVGLAERRGTIWDRMLALARRTTTPDGYYDVFARIAADPAVAVEDEFTLADSDRTFTAYTVGVTDSSGAVIGRIFSIREITAIRESDRLKDEFVATVSHELRTPLTSIVGYAEVLLGGDDLGETTRQFLEVIDRNAHRLQRLVGDLLFFAQVESRQLQLERERLDLRALAERSLEATRPAAEAKRLTLEFDAPSVVEVDGDAARLEQLVDNLLSNAVKFTLDGGRVSVRIQKDGESARLDVADTGIGVPPDEVKGLFRRFFRSTSAMSREIPGTGLGLAIAKAIVEAHGGTIDVESSERGTTFTVRLPRASSAEDDLPVPGVAAPFSA